MCFQSTSVEEEGLEQGAARRIIGRLLQSSWAGAGCLNQDKAVGGGRWQLSLFTCF